MADPHTGLANQLLLLDRLTQALVRRRRHGGEVVVCHIDLDNLGEINADLGYTTGNTVLCETSRRLTSVLRTEDTVGRVGGSELVVVVTVTDEQATGPLMRRIQHTLDEPVTVGGQDIRLHSSLGVAIAEEAESAEDVLALGRPLDARARSVGPTAKAPSDISSPDEGRAMQLYPSVGGGMPVGRATIAFDAQVVPNKRSGVSTRR